MKINTKKITVPNQEWKLFTLVNDNGMEVSFLNYGGAITKILVPNRDNTFENVVLGYKEYEDYIENPVFLGALIGRVAGRIQGSQFVLDGTTYTLPANNGENHLHGGPTGFHSVAWESDAFETENEVGVNLSHTSNDGDGGYPGNLTMKVTYTLDNSNNFSITYEGSSDQKTVLTATNHSYFNLSGNLKENILEHEVTLDSSSFVELDEDLIPTGKEIAVEGTSFDFRNGQRIKVGAESNNPQNKVASNGYDQNFIFDDNKKEKAIVRDYTSGRELVVTTDQPGVVLYSSNSMDESLNLVEGSSRKYLGLCLETQSSPASLNHEGFPGIVLDKGEKYQSKTTFSFNLINK
ncbi:galactose-1-epimerase [Aquibacillus halophilus]|uniref:Aldose 1-epimerase n=1 Tax=Aquibacillus halophilus TaxID=930132 RepID=A0A6A8DMG6_9BACI|nr:aldose epimerase family protein [Aquibacillus halophilus]MRH44217.1 galactose-1-epimerase [Aquibacillus halophilus]